MDYRLMAVSQKGRREQFINRWESTLSSGISNTDTTIPVVDGSDLPTEGDWRLLIGSEILLATARSGNNITAVRGQEGTTATSHSSAAEIKAVATAGGLQKFLLDNRGTGFTEESSANSVPLCRCLDQNSAILTASSFTWVNQGSATCTDSSDGGLLLTLPNEANFQFRGKFISLPTTPYKFRARIWMGPGVGSPGSSGTIIAGLQDFIQRAAHPGGLPRGREYRYVAIH
jgi:hypothetical protein